MPDCETYIINECPIQLVLKDQPYSLYHIIRMLSFSNRLVIYAFWNSRLGKIGRYPWGFDIEYVRAFKSQHSIGTTSLQTPYELVAVVADPGELGRSRSHMSDVTYPAETAL